MKKIKVAILIFIVLISVMGLSYAKANNTYKVVMESEKNKFYYGETVKISVKLKDITLENGIVAYSTLLSYDKEIFEEPVISGSQNWEKPNVVENLIQGITSTMQAINEDDEIMEISLRAKGIARDGKTKIVLSKFEVSDGDNTIEGENSEIELEIKDAKVEFAENSSIQGKEIIMLGVGFGCVICAICVIIFIKKHKK